MDTNTLQLLTFFAGRTKRIDFGTMVVVLPWHDPIRVAEEASMLDNLLQGRKLHLGFGRGAAKVEFDGFRIEMDSSRERFLDSLAVVRKALSQKRFSHKGPHHTIPELSLRPRPRSGAALLDRMYMSWGSPSSVAVAAENGLLPLVIPQKQWETHVREMEDYNRIRLDRGMAPGRPTVLLAVYVSEDEDEANTIGHQYIHEYADSARRHYQFDNPAHLANVKGYDYYNDTARKWAAEHAAPVRPTGGASPGDAFMKVFTDSHVWGTPKQVIEQIRERMNGVGGGEFVGVFKYGSMPYDKAEKNIRLFAEKVLPALKQMETPAPRLPQGVTA
jgi:alkanesulfonate monooxygenase SsuD/methylene tetrahydromethanopterin reductase-like flavin-dependent oxidoreductase (luciferase family)